MKNYKGILSKDKNELTLVDIASEEAIYFRFTLCKKGNQCENCDMYSFCDDTDIIDYACFRRHDGKIGIWKEIKNCNKPTKIHLLTEKEWENKNNYRETCNCCDCVYYREKGDFPGEHYPHCSLKEVECNINSWYANLEKKDCICDRFIKK